MQENNNSYYDQGVVDGLAQALDKINIEYEYHQHVNGTGKVCSEGTQFTSPEGCFTKKVRVATGQTRVCGSTNIVRDSTVGVTYRCADCGEHHENYVSRCDNIIPVYATYYVVGCGYSDSQPIAAHITF